VKIVAFVLATMQSQETCPDAVAAFECPRKGVQAAGISLFRKRSRRQPVAFAWQKRWRDFEFSAKCGVRRHGEAAAALWIVDSNAFDEVKAGSRYACRRTPNLALLVTFLFL